MGADAEDITQEGMMGLFKAIRDYDFNRGASFETYANLCITRQIINALKIASRKKHAPLNSYISLDFEAALTANNVLPTGESPEELYIVKEEGRKIIDEIYSLLSGFEASVLDLYLEGKNYTEIAVLLNKNEKSVDNAIQRIRKKTASVAT